MKSLYLILFGQPEKDEMSYNIDKVIKVSGQLFMQKSIFKKLYKKNIDYLAEDNLFTTYNNEHFDKAKSKDQPPLELRCSGMSSGGFYKNALPDILKHTTGEAEYVFIWEGGDSITGLHIKNGVVTEKGVRLSLE